MEKFDYKDMEQITETISAFFDKFGNGLGNLANAFNDKYDEVVSELSGADAEKVVKEMGRISEFKERFEKLDEDFSKVFEIAKKMYEGEQKFQIVDKIEVLFRKLRGKINGYFDEFKTVDFKKNASKIFNDEIFDIDKAYVECFNSLKNFVVWFNLINGKVLPQWKKDLANEKIVFESGLTGEDADDLLDALNS